MSPKRAGPKPRAGRGAGGAGSRGRGGEEAVVKKPRIDGALDLGGACTICEGTNNAGPVPGSCASCWSLYSSSFSMLGDWDTFGKQLAADEELQAQWDEAQQVERDAVTKTWWPQTVSAESSTEVLVSKKLVGVPRAELKALLDGHDPEAVGIRLYDLPSYDGSTFRGVLMPAPGSAFVEYTIQTKDSANLTKVAMEPAAQKYSAQSKRTHEFVQQEQESSKSLAVVYLKAKTQTLTHEGLQQRLREYKEKQSAMEQKEKQAERERWEEGTPGAAGSAGDLAIKGPLLNARAVRDSLSTLDGSPLGSLRKTGSGGGPSLGTKPRGRLAKEQAILSGEAKSGDQELVDRKIAALSLAAILSGRALGRELRWAKEACATIKPGSREHTELSLHIDLAQAAVSIAEGNLLQMADSDLNPNLQLLADNGIDLPSTTKQLLLQRKCKAYEGATSAKELMQMVLMVVPWRPANEDAGVCSEFNPLSPKLYQMEGSEAEKAVHFVTFVCDALLRVVLTEEQGLSLLLDFCRQILCMLEESFPEDLESEAIENGVNGIIEVVQAMVALADLKCILYHSSVEKLASSATSGQGAIQTFARAIRANDFWNARRMNYLTTYKATKDTRQMFENHQQMLQQGNAMQLLRNGTLLKLLEEAQTWKSKVRAGCCDGLLSKANDLLVEVFSKEVVPDRVPASRAEAASMLEECEKFKRVLLQAKEVLPQTASKWSLFLSNVAALEIAASRSMAGSTLEQLASATTVESFASEEGRQLLHANIISFLSSGAAPSAGVVQAGESVFDCMHTFVSEKAESHGQVEALLPLIQALLSAGLVSGAKRELASQVAMLASTWQPLMNSLDVWMGLGDDNAARRAAANGAGEDAARALVVNFAKVKESAELVQLSAWYQSEYDKVSKELAAIQEDVFKSLAPQIKEACSALQPVCDGGDAGEDWKAALPREPTAEDVFSTARDTIVRIDGPKYEEKIKSLRAALQASERWHGIFGVHAQTPEVVSAENILARASAVKYASLMVTAQAEHGANPMSLRRYVKRYRAAAEAEHASAFFPKALWEWSAAASSLSR